MVNFEIMRPSILLILLLWCLLGLSQTSEIDSLIQLIHQDVEDSSKAKHLNQLAWKFMFTNPDTTILIAKESIQISERLEDKEFLVNAVNNLATAHAVKGDLDQSLILFRKAEQHALQINSPKNLAMIQNNIGLVFWNQGLLDSAIVVYKSAIANFLKQGELKVGSANTHNNIGLIYNDLGNADSAIFHYKMALKIFDSLDVKNRGVANTYNNIGVIYKEKGNLPISLEYYLKSLKIFEESNDFSDGYANTLNNIGIIYKELDDNTKALEYYQKAKTAFEVISQQSLGLSNTLLNIGTIYKINEDYDTALLFYQEALSMQESIGEKSLSMANSLSNIGIIKELRGQTEIALEYFEQALNIQEEIGDSKGITNSLYYIGNLQVENNILKLGIDNCRRSLKKSKELGFLEAKMNACHCLSAGYEKLRNAENAYSYFKQYVAFKDSLDNRENTKAITQKAMQYEFDKIQYQDSLQRAEIEKRKALEQREKDLKKEAEIQRQRFYTTTGGIGVILLMGLAIVLFRGYKNKMKANEIITAQKEKVEEQKIEVEQQKDIIEEKNREIVDSITYAKRIQGAILPSQEYMKELLNDSFVLFLPKDIVSGDFYWVAEKDQKVYFSAIDCTGHGVPGAMVSVVGFNALNRVLNEYEISEPAKMLDKMNEIVEETFETSENDVKDGMDMGLCCIDKSNMTIQYAGANNPLYLIRNNELIEIKADKQPIGKYDYRTQFTAHHLSLEKGDCIYVFSDGFADQFGGPKGKKLMYKPFKRLLTEMSSLEMPLQKNKLMQAFFDWKGELEQIDDVCVFGVRV